MDYKETLINQILVNCNGIMSQHQINQLYNVLSSALYPYTIELEEERESIVASVDEYNIELINKYLLQKTIEGKSEGTVRLYNYRLRQFITSINKRVNEITTDDIKQYIAAVKFKTNCSGTTIDHIRICIGAFYTWMTENEYIRKNPAKLVGKIKNDTVKEDPFTVTEVELIRNACKSLRNRALVEFLLATGCRVSETASMNKDQIDFVNKQFKVVGKGNKIRKIPINDKALLYIKQYLDERTDNNLALFVGLIKPHNRLSKDAIENTLKNLESVSGVDNIHPHRFRRTLCCNLIDGGMPIFQVAEILGHNSITTTEVYYSQSKYQIAVNYNKIINR